LEDARRYFKQALESAAPEDHAHWTAVTLDHLALVEKRLANYDEALRLSLQSLVQHRQLGDSGGEELCLKNLGSLFVARQEYTAAITYLQQSLAICEREGIISTRGFNFCNLMDIAIKMGDLAAAESHAKRILEVADATSNRALVSWERINGASLAVRRGDIDAARGALAEGLSIGLELGSPALKFDAVRSFAEILNAQGETACAHSVLVYAADLPIANGQIRDQVRRQLYCFDRRKRGQTAHRRDDVRDRCRRQLGRDDSSYKTEAETDAKGDPNRRRKDRGDRHQS
jgi:tetratricopeptide (TPR) repeat protein